MAVTYFNNKRHQIDVLITANATITVAGNNSVSNIAYGTDQTVIGAGIKQMWAMSPSGNSAYWTISRGANLVAAPDSTAYLDFAGNGSSLNVDSTGTIVVTLVGATVGTLMLTLHKQGELPDGSTY